jgi:hypothetical protein
LGADFDGYQPRPSIHLALAPAPPPFPVGLTRGRIRIRPDHALGAIAITLETPEGPVEMTLVRDAAVSTIVAMIDALVALEPGGTRPPPSAFSPNPGMGRGGTEQAHFDNHNREARS